MRESRRKVAVGRRRAASDVRVRPGEPAFFLRLRDERRGYQFDLLTNLVRWSCAGDHLRNPDGRHPELRFESTATFVEGKRMAEVIDLATTLLEVESFHWL